MNHRRDEGSMILLLLNKKETLSIDELKEEFFKFASQFGYGNGEFHERGRRNHQKDDFFAHLDQQINTLEKEKLILIEDHKISLTEKGKIESAMTCEKFEKASGWMHRNLLSVEATSRNTVIIDAILAVIKLFAGIVSGSVGLIADGTDAALDTLSAGVVFWSVKKNKEIIGTFVIIFMMFLTAIGLGVDSINSVTGSLTGIAEQIKTPYLVIVTETIALVFAIILMLYQRFTGKREKSFALITQSVDSKNHIYVAIAVISGAVLSMMGIIIVDSLIGVYIAVKIFIDAVQLFRETISSMQGEDINFEKYEGFLDKKWKENKMNSFRAVIIYHILQKGTLTREELTDILQWNFKPSYLPVLSEFKIGLHTETDFDKNFNLITAPLIERGMISTTENGFSINQETAVRIEEYVSNTLIQDYNSENFRKQIKRLRYSHFDRIDGIEKINKSIQRDEKITAITRAQYDKHIHTLLTSNKRILIFKHRGKDLISINYTEIRKILQERGKMSCMRLVLITENKQYIFDYLSHRKSFGFISELQKRTGNIHSEGQKSKDDAFYLKIKTLSKIQTFLTKKGMK
ncbi:MAG TPA: cation transporter [Thermotogota bacterium]|nr:cation transporter [Thermotogota bacterium]HPJ89388.1 cation transporter [Thermotogota bacterium]HPR96588.1 cation transporter [Thermotogota bacterium]